MTRAAGNLNHSVGGNLPPTEVQTYRHLGTTSWQDPKTGTQLWILAALVTSPIWTTALIVGVYVIARCGSG